MVIKCLKTRCGRRFSECSPGLLSDMELLIFANVWRGRSSDIGLFELRDLLDLCSLLYEPKTSLVVRLRYPRYWRCQHLGKVGLSFCSFWSFSSYTLCNPCFPSPCLLCSLSLPHPLYSFPLYFFTLYVSGIIRFPLPTKQFGVLIFSPT